MNMSKLYMLQLFYDDVITNTLYGGSYDKINQLSADLISEGYQIVLYKFDCYSCVYTPIKYSCVKQGKTTVITL